MSKKEREGGKEGHKKRRELGRGNEKELRGRE